MHLHLTGTIPNEETNLENTLIGSFGQNTEKNFTCAVRLTLELML